MITLIPHQARMVAGLAVRSAAQTAGALGTAVSPQNADPGVWRELSARSVKPAGLLEHCRAHIFGQDEALKVVCLATWASLVGLKPPNHTGSARPLAVFLVFGPTGVGKTQTAKEISTYLDGVLPAILPMNEFGDSSVATFKEALAHKVRGDGPPRRVLMLDEIEKASRHATDVLLSVFDEGRMGLSGSDFLDFSQSIILVSSNIGSDRLHGMMGDNSPSTYETMRDFVFGQAALQLRPELFARATRQVFYLPLSDAVQRQITRQVLQTKLDYLAGMLAGARIDVAESAWEAIVGMGFHDQKRGARGLDQLVDEMVDLAVARALGSPIPPQPPLQLRAFTAVSGASELEFISLPAAMSSLPGAVFPR